MGHMKPPLWDFKEKKISLTTQCTLNQHDLSTMKHFDEMQTNVVSMK